MHPALNKLKLADPDLARSYGDRLDRGFKRLPQETVRRAVEMVIAALAQETAYGYALTEGYACLLETADGNAIERYTALIDHANRKGPTRGHLMARYAHPVLAQADEPLWQLFMAAVDTLLTKGEYALKRPLSILSRLLKEPDLAAARAFLRLLCDAFCQTMSYNRALHFCYTVPPALVQFDPDRRVWQIDQLRRVVQVDFRLADDFLEGMANGLQLLSRSALIRFIATGLDYHNHRNDRGRLFIALRSDEGRQKLNQLQVTVSLAAVAHRLNRYIQARTGLPLSVRPISDLPAVWRRQAQLGPAVLTDSRCIYLPPEIDRYQDRPSNQRLYKCLARFEVGHFEFGSHLFDLQRARQKYPQLMAHTSKTPADSKSDLEHFLATAIDPLLAEDLFTLFEHGRVRIKLAEHYPGLLRRYLPLMQRESASVHCSGLGSALYAGIALGLPPKSSPALGPGDAKLSVRIQQRFERQMAIDDSVDSSVLMVATTLPLICSHLDADGGKTQHPFLRTPFARRIRPALIASGHRSFERIAQRIQQRLAKKGIQVFKSDLLAPLQRKQGQLAVEDVVNAWRSHRKFQERFGKQPTEQLAPEIELAPEDWCDPASPGDNPPIDDPSASSWYREWNHQINTYLHRHARVTDRMLPLAAADFYEQTLKRHRGLVGQIRYAFELMKPAGIKLLRQWVEGDAFDHRALIDFAVDRAAGRMPSDRLYIKRDKKIRDVAVLLLVDVSRSTHNPVAGSTATVLHLEQEALVLFCEALNLLGDDFALAGFSGTGRLGVDFYRIKDFDQSLNDAVRSRIGNLAPQRSTRMGAAIRHATHLLSQRTNRIRILIILGDGFPNDSGYKGEYAIADTRKAIAEAQARSIHTHGITVNISADPRLDDLYGHVRHNVLSDVRQLPDQLVRIYSALTH